MVKAEVKTKSGAHIVIEGTEAEVKRVLATVVPIKEAASEKMRNSKQSSNKMSINDLLQELTEEKFFDKPKSLVEIKNALEEKGRIYSITTLSPKVLQRVRKRRLGRIKSESKWKYVTR